MPTDFFKAVFTFSFAILTMAAGGCSRAPIPEYVLAAELEELPELHREQIAATLKQYFGTPLNPRMAAPAPLDEEAEEPSEEEAADENGDAEADAGEEAVDLVDLVGRDQLAHGASVYRVRCAGCHGVNGDGNGPAAEYLVPKPRDYRRGVYKFTSTPYGQKPTRADLVRTIRRGAKGTSMPAFPWLAEEDLQAVIDYIVSISQRGEVERMSVYLSDEYEEDQEIEPADFSDTVLEIQAKWRPESLDVVEPVTAPPAYDDDSIIAGRKAFLSRGCAQCHGIEGKGQTKWLNPEFLAMPEGEREKINYDEWGNPAPAANITARMLHGGRRPLDVYRRVYTGINGTPMPAFGEALAAEPDTIWHLVHYVLSIVEGRQVDFGEEAVDAAESPTPG